MPTLRELQDVLPWAGSYNRKFENDQSVYRDFRHALLHTVKAVGGLSDVVGEADHLENLRPLDEQERIAKYLADLVYCALRMATTAPLGEIDLESALVKRIEQKNNVRLDDPATLRVLRWTRWQSRDMGEQCRGVNHSGRCCSLREAHPGIHLARSGRGVFLEWADPPSPAA